MAAIIKVTPATTRTIQKPIPIYSTPPAKLPTATVKGVDIRRLTPSPMWTTPTPAYIQYISPKPSRSEQFPVNSENRSFWLPIIGGAVGCFSGARVGILAGPEGALLMCGVGATAGIERGQRASDVLDAYDGAMKILSY